MKFETVSVTSDEEMAPVAVAMKKAAQAFASVSREPAQYSKTYDEGVKSSLRILSTPGMAPPFQRMVIFKGYQCFNILSVTIEELNGGPPMWHLSMSAGNGIGPIKMPDELAMRFARAFSPDLVEGPPEGVFEYVRHFRGPYRQD